MSTPASRSAGGDGPGQAIAAARKAQGLTQSELARRAAVSLSLLRKIERGSRSLTPGVRAALDTVLTPLAGSGGAAASRAHHRSAPAAQRSYGHLRHPARPAVCHPANRGTSPHDELGDDLAAILPVRQARRAPPRVNHRPDSRRPEQRRTRAGTGVRTPGPCLPRRRRHRRQARPPRHVRPGDRTHPLGSGALRRPATGDDERLRPRRTVLHRAARPQRPAHDRRRNNSALPARRGPAARDARGTVHARRRPRRPRRDAGRSGRPDQPKHVRSHGKSQTAVYHGTAFGPGSVRVHELALAVEAGDVSRAVKLADQWQPPLALPAERRSHFHIEAARAYCWARNRDQAVTALWQARRAAPQHARCNPAVIETIGVLIRGSRKPPPPLIQLAAWIGHL